MNLERWLLANACFEDIVQLPAPERQGALDRLCGHDPNLRHEVADLLRADEAAAAQDFLGAAPPLEVSPGATTEIPWHIEPAALPKIATPALERLGPYRIQEEIGSGGMGTIYAAVRDDDTMDQRVAIKVIRAGAENADIVRRMWMERRILARLQHPNIARIYDAGSTEAGLPYFVMELVEGLPIDQFCDRHGLGLRDRLRLIRNVCAAVDYANENLVVHRDLKPSNILVTPSGEPKLLDFGIAKILEPDHSPGPSARRTEPWRQRLTPEFASPEQIRGQPVSVSCDVYSLGVLLFLLLTGRVPRSAEDVTPWLFERSRRSTDPPKPSEVMAESDATDGTTAPDPRRAKELRGDLDSIVLGALQEEPGSRYSSARELGEDLDRYLGGFPVKARHGSAPYRLGKFLRRHLVAVWVAVVVIGLGGTLAGTWVHSSIQAARSRVLLESEHAKNQQILQVFQGFFEQAGPVAADGVELTLREAVDRYLQGEAERFPEHPELQASLFSTLGWIYLDLGDAEKAQGFHRRALAVLRSGGGDSVREAESMVGVAAALSEQGLAEQAERLSSEALAEIEQLATADPLLRLRALNHRVGIFCSTQDWQAAEPLSRKALQLSRELSGTTSSEIPIAAVQRAYVLRWLGDLEGARELYSVALGELNRRFGPRHPLLALIYNNVAKIHDTEGNVAEAMAMWREADRRYREIYGDDYYERVKPLSNLGKALLDAGRAEEAEVLLRQALGVAEASPLLGPSLESTYFGRPAIHLADLLWAADRCDELVALLEPKYLNWSQKSRSRRRAGELIDQCRGVASRSKKVESR